MIEVMRSSQRHAVLTVLLLFATSIVASGQTTAFTYQGQLSDAGALGNGSYDLRFGLFDSAAGGAQIGANQIVAAVPVSDGVFTVQLDFGVGAFPGANRFVEIAVKPAGGGSFTTLAPRQQIGSSPYAIRTLSAAAADTLSSACVGCVTDAQIQAVAGSKVGGTIPATSLPTGSGSYIQNTTAQQASSNFNVSGNGVVGGDLTVAGTLNANVSGNFIQNRTTPQAGANFNIGGTGSIGGLLSATSVGVATTNPQSPLSVRTDTQTYGFTHTDGVVTLGSYIGIGSGQIGTRSNHPLSFFTNDSAPRMTIDRLGNVGIGTLGGTSDVRLFVDGGPAWTSASWQASLAFANRSAIGWSPTDSGQQFGIGQTNGGLYFFQTEAAFGETGSAAHTDMVITEEGRVGIGVDHPITGLLEVGGPLKVSGGAFGYGDVYADRVFVNRVVVNGPVTAESFITASSFNQVSDRNVKANFSRVEPRSILLKLVALPVQTWNFRNQPETGRYLGPVAQDFRAAFDLGEDDKHIATVDADGVALAAIQGLYQMVRERDRQLEELQVRVRQLERQVQHRRVARGS